jgi:glycine/D-amino acid oxidase-like deaminating enzyme
MNADYAIIGGGIVGLSLAWGMLKKGKNIIVVDGHDVASPASRGNFGLIWIQGKGINNTQYAQWSQKSVAAWPQFAEELQEHTGINISLEQKGGYDFHFSEKSLEKTLAQYTSLKQKLNGNYPYDVLTHNNLKKEEPLIGPKVIGAILHHQDGQVNPLQLLKALLHDITRMKGILLTKKTVTDISKNDSFRLTCHDGTSINAKKIILAAGLGTAKLAPKLGFKVPIQPQKGQMLITEKLPKMINRPSLIARQVNEGGIQIGFSEENVGFNEQVSQNQIAKIAADAIKTYPTLAKAQIIRTWAALRIVSRDGFPIYQESLSTPGAFIVTCHSGITLAAAHALFLPEWLEGNSHAPNLKAFHEDRFSLPPS